MVISASEAVITMEWRTLLRHHYKVTTFCFQHMVGSKLAIAEISLSTGESSSVMLATRAVTHLVN
jgi:hypothetical protein